MNNTINSDLSDYLDKYGYTDSQKLKVQEKLVKWVEDCKPKLFEDFHKEEQYSLELADKIVQLVNKRVDESMLNESEDMNTWPIANTASRNLTGGNKALGSLMLCLLAELTSEKKFVSLAKKMSSNSSDSTNESAELHLYKKIQGLTSKQQSYLLEMLEGCTIDEIEKRFDLLLRESSKSDEFKHTCVCPHCDHEMESTKECNLLECPECGESKMKTKKSVNDGIGFTELGKVNEDKSPFDDDLDQYKNIWNKE